MQVDTPPPTKNDAQRYAWKHLRYGDTRNTRPSPGVWHPRRLEPIPVGAAPSHCTRRRCSESSCTVSTFRFLRSGATHTASARLPTEIGS
ncbi:hypothetical protein Cenrod_2487 [Candidatus Symbiobacter mobilis CR]|uniref:Uncharacterized protein n=1 Tax=Candidatus Symbiobacter mobilis CR TaxID=946483 RepID=U5NAG2_9BURK|nr:hypothetical protein Cenrod_2487 [Candidatus Symbiobacter mobilis CR]